MAVNRSGHHVTDLVCVSSTNATQCEVRIASDDYIQSLLRLTIQHQGTAKVGRLDTRDRSLLKFNSRLLKPLCWDLSRGREAFWSLARYLR